MEGAQEILHPGGSGLCCRAWYTDSWHIQHTLVIIVNDNNNNNNKAVMVSNAL